MKSEQLYSQLKAFPPEECCADGLVFLFKSGPFLFHAISSAATAVNVREVATIGGFGDCGDT